MTKKPIADDDIPYVPKERLEEFEESLSSGKDFDFDINTDGLKEVKREEEKDIVSQIAEYDSDEDEDNMSDDDFGDLTAQIKAKIAKENPELVAKAEAEKKAKRG